jgi:hypothetical protein
MRVYFSGAENPGWRNKLVAWNATAVAFNFKHLIPRLPKKSPFLLSDRLPADVHVMSYFEVPPEAPELADLYLNWVALNADRLDFAVEPDGLSAEDAEARRADSTCLPIWRPETGHRALQKLAERYTGIAVLQSAWDSDKPVTPRLNRMVASEGTYVHGLGVSMAEILAAVAFGSVSTGSWMSASRYGETQIWDGSELRRFPATDKESRQRYRAHIAHSGLDLDKIDADDQDEVCKLAVWSWQQLEDWLSRRREVPTEVSMESLGRTQYDAEMEESAIEVSEGFTPTTTGRRRGTKAAIRATSALPIMESVVTEGAEHAIRIRSESSRICDECSVSEVCPGYEEGSACAYSIPVSIQSKDQLVSLLNGVLEMQAQRVLFARFREDLEGGVDPVVSKEVDRLFNITAQYKDIVDNSESLKVQIEAKGGAGALSRLFGARVGEQARALPGGGLDTGDTDRLLADVVGTTVLDPVDWSRVGDVDE